MFGKQRLSLTEIFLRISMNRPKGSLCAGHGAGFFLWRQLDVIKRCGECPPMQAATFRRSGQMARAEFFVETQLGGILQQKCSTEV